MVKPCPDAYCVKCKTPALHHGPKCLRPVGINKICGGGTRSANNVGDWKQCPDCAGEGCNACMGFAWQLVREGA